MRARLLCILYLAVSCLGASAAPAQTGDQWIITTMGGVIRPDVTWDKVRAHMLVVFYQSNPGERGVTADGIEDMRRIMMAQRRSQATEQILSYDLDGDGIVTREEITAVMQPRARQMINANGVQLEPTAQQTRQQLDRLVGEALKPDLDGDGTISAEEIRQEAQKQADLASEGWQRGAARFVPMTLDADGDGAVSLAEYEAAVRKQFDAIDKDRDGRLSTDEVGEFNQRLTEAFQAAQREREAQIRKQRLESAAKGCEVPPAQANVRLALLGAREARALSNAWIGSEDKVTYVTTVEIAPGRDPLYLALASQGAMIWDVVGATERVAGVVAHAEATLDDAGDGLPQRFVAANGQAAPPRGGKPLVGVIGIPRDKVHFTAHKGCLVPVSEASMKDGSAQEMAALVLGREADEIGGEVSAATFRVPPLMHFKDRVVRNAMPLPKGGAGEVLWREVEDRYSAGIAQIDVDSVVSVHPVKRYAVLPARAGLAQLVDANALQVAGFVHGFHLDEGEIHPFTSPNKFVIMQKMQIPAGATGTFILPRELPLPQGDLSQVCVLSETDMKPVNGDRRGRC
jgi:Ca2+-binding EF-hand superfamily protein